MLQSQDVNQKNRNCSKKMISSTCHRKSLMLSIFWDSSDNILHDFAGKDDRINSSCYSNLVSQAKKLGRKWRKLDLYYLHDNAAIHTSLVSRATIEGYGLNVILHLPYSPDLAPSEFYLFSNLKKTPRVQQFYNKEYLKAAVEIFRWRTPRFIQKSVCGTCRPLEKMCRRLSRLHWEILPIWPMCYKNKCLNAIPHLFLVVSPFIGRTT